MSGGESAANDTATMAEVAMLAQRAGLRLSASDLNILLDSYRGSQRQLGALRTAIASTEEPDFTFDPTRVTASK